MTAAGGRGFTLGRAAATASALALLAITCAGVAATRPGDAAAAPKAAGYVDALISLKHPPGLERFARRVSDPTSPSYGDYATVEALIKRFGPKPKAKKRTMSYLRRHRVDATLARTGTFAVARISDEEARRLFAPQGGIASVSRDASLDAEVPVELRPYVDEVTLLSTEPAVERYARRYEGPIARSSKGQPLSARLRSGTPAGCPEATGEGAGFTPNQYLSAYGHRALHRRGARGRGGRVAVVEVDGFLRSDLETFGRCFGIRIPKTPITTVFIPRKLPQGIETTLDLELMSAAAPGLRAIDVYQGAQSNAGVMATMAGALGPKGRHPEVISASLGICEPLLRKSPNVVQTGDEILALAAAAGISVLVSSGDHGSSGCLFETGKAAAATSYPATSPWATAVGGTNLGLTPSNRIAQQPVWNDSPIQIPFGGGGGLSTLGQRPFYQHGERFKQASRRRIVPDVSALADLIPGYQLYCTAPGGANCDSAGWTQIGGTSAASPLTAGGIALVNQLRRRQGQPRLGFLNPLLYHLGRTLGKRRPFSDVVLGNNNMSAALTPEDGKARVRCCTALKGYDRASGWGSIVFPKFHKAAGRFGG